MLLQALLGFVLLKGALSEDVCVTVIPAAKIASYT